MDEGSFRSGGVVEQEGVEQILGFLLPLEELQPFLELAVLAKHDDEIGDDDHHDLQEEDKDYAS